MSTRPQSTQDVQQTALYFELGWWLKFAPSIIPNRTVCADSAAVSRRAVNMRFNPSSPAVPISMRGCRFAYRVNALDYRQGAAPGVFVKSRHD